MDIRKIRKLIEIMVEADLESIEVKEGDQSIALKRHLPALTYASPPNSILPAIVQPSILAETNTGLLELSPMVGVFYAAPTPNEPKFVQVGQSVSIGDKLGIIEAMKIMNPILATHNGVIDAILVDNGQVVEHSQPLFRIRPV